MMYQRRPYKGVRVGLAVDAHGSRWVSAGDLFDVVPRNSWSWLMAKVQPKVINRLLHLPLSVVKSWPADLRKREHKDIARGLEHFLDWADAQFLEMKAGAPVA